MLNKLILLFLLIGNVCFGSEMFPGHADFLLHNYYQSLIGRSQYRYDFEKLTVVDNKVYDLAGNENTITGNVSIGINGAVLNGTLGAITPSRYGNVITDDFIDAIPFTSYIFVRANSYGEGANGTIFDNKQTVLFLYTGNKLTFSSNYSSIIQCYSAFPLNKNVVVCVSRTSTGKCNIYIDGELCSPLDGNSGTPGDNTTKYLRLGNRDELDRAWDGNIYKLYFFMNEIHKPSKVKYISNLIRQGRR